MALDNGAYRLRDVSVIFTHDSGELVHKPLETTSGRMDERVSNLRFVYRTLTVLNLPPRQWVHLELHGALDDTEAMKGWRKAEFLGQRQKKGLFVGKAYRKELATR